VFTHVSLQYNLKQNKTKQKMKNLADFKRFLTANIGNKQVLLSSKVIANSTGEAIRDNSPAPIHIVQSNSFAVKRGETTSWMEFGKAKDWSFYGEEEAELKAKHNARPNDSKYCNIIFTIHKQ